MGLSNEREIELLSSIVHGVACTSCRHFFLENAFVRATNSFLFKNSKEASKLSVSLPPIGMAWNL